MESLDHAKVRKYFEKYPNQVAVGMVGIGFFLLFGNWWMDNILIF